jgi:hypothetical protein
MGLDEERFIEPIDENLKCSICLAIFLDPVEVCNLIKKLLKLAKINF